MNVETFKRILIEANGRASVASRHPDNALLRGDCVIVCGLPERCRSLALRLGADAVIGGVLFMPAQYAEPRIRSKRNWAHTFQQVLVDAGLKAYVMELSMRDL